MSKSISMKRFAVALIAILGCSMLSGVSFHEPPVVKQVKKYSPSCGYTIVEFGVGIDCNGDTVRIVKKGGAQVLAYK